MTTHPAAPAGGPAPDGLDLGSCDREPIHIVGSVQPHGFLLALDARTLTVVQASANAPLAASVGTAVLVTVMTVAALDPAEHGVEGQISTTAAPTTMEAVAP